MEDCNALAADCIVISCCCQCLILQILVFLLLKLPCKLIRKTRDFARRKIRERKERGKKMINAIARELVGKRENESEGNVGGEPIRVQDDDGKSIGGTWHNGQPGCCVDEIEKVMEELYRKGEFGFGSFWCKEGEEEEEKEDESKQFFSEFGKLSRTC